MTKSVSLAILLSGAVAFVLGACTEREAPATARTPNAQRADTQRLVRIQPPITSADVRGTTLSLGDIDTILALTGRGPIILTDTVFSDSAAAVSVTALPSLLASSAPRPDGARSAVLPVLVETGGSGVFVHLLALERGESGLRQTGETFLGDRVKVGSVALRGDTALVEMTVHNDGDARCCPTLKVRQRYLLAGGPPQPIGTDTLGTTPAVADTAKAVVPDSSAKRKRRIR